ncbi:MAG: TolC family protein [Bacteroidales bacterium]|nr:TolC family protein [Bacteroidales bacterium]
MQKFLFLTGSVLLGIITFAQNADNKTAIPGAQEDKNVETAEEIIQFSSFQEVLEYANANAISIQNATSGEEIALLEKKESRSYLLPSLNTSVGYIDNIDLQPALLPAQIINPGAPEGTFEELTFGTKYSASWSLQAQWDVLDFQRIFAVQTSSIAVDQSKANTDLNRYSTYNLIASTYYSILLTQESIDIYEENVRVSGSIFKNANEKYLKGIISEAELNRAEIKNLQNQMILDRARSNLDQLYIQLQSQLNTSEHIIITDAPENLGLENTTFQNPHPEITWQELEVEKFESILKQQKAIRLPSVSLVYQNNHTWAWNDFMDFGNAYKLPQQSFGIKLTMPLVNFSIRQEVTQTKLNLQMNQEQLKNTRLVKTKEDELLKLQLNQASELLKQNTEVLSLQIQNDAHTENIYLSGIMSLDERLDKYDDLLAAQNNYLESLAELTLAQYKAYIRQINY